MVVTLTVSAILKKGLEFAGFSADRQKNVKKSTNVDRFRAYYGSNPIVYAQLWEDLQNVAVLPGNWVDLDEEKDITYFFMCLHFLKSYPIETDLAGIFQVCEKTVRKWVWMYATRFQGLKHHKVHVNCDCVCFIESIKSYHPLLHNQIRWPDSWHVNSPNETMDIFLASVDGVHCRISEPRHATLSRDPKFYSHKFNQAALGYEIGVSLFDNNIVWVNGPFEAGTPDISIFRNGGLKEMVPAGKRIVADNGYQGERAIISTPNSHDAQELRKFKRRARSRHETINARFKNFRILDSRFRHERNKHSIAFEAVCVICQYQLELGSPLFDV
jgi:DDE superfamily endonuclease